MRVKPQREIISAVMLRKPFSIGILLSLVVLLIFTATYHSRKTLEGRVFIVTRSAENIKLGLVSIYIFTEEQTKTHLTNVNLITKGQLTDLQLRLFVLNALYDATNKLRDDLRSAQQESSKATAEAAKSGELKIQGYTSHPTTTIRPDAEYKEQTRRLRLDYHYITTSSYTVYSKTAEQEVRQKLVLLTKQQADVDRRQKLWEQWDPIWQKHYSVTQNLSNQIVNVVTSLAAITDLIDRQKRLLKSNIPKLSFKINLSSAPIHFRNKVA